MLNKAFVCFVCTVEISLERDKRKKKFGIKDLAAEQNYFTARLFQRLAQKACTDKLPSVNQRLPQLCVYPFTH